MQGLVKNNGAIAFCAALLGIGGCAQNATYQLVTPEKEIILDDLKSPWGMAFISGAELLITEKQGDLLKVDLKTGASTAVTGFPADLLNSPQKGVLSDNSGMFDVALHPNFGDNHLVYITYSAAAQSGATTKLIRGTLKGAALVNVEELFVATPFTPNEFYHYGGGLTFGADGKLYLTIGERLYSEADQPTLPIAQNTQDRRGKIYRFNDDGTIPADNPNFGPDAIPGLFAIGIRASQGITTHPITGEIWFTEHGTHQGDEINILKAGANYGWPVKTTGGYRADDYAPPEMEGVQFTKPAWYWLQTVAPTGLDFYDGNEFRAWKGNLFVAGLSRGSLWRVNIEKGAVKSLEELFVDQRARTRDVAVAPDGKLYILTDLLFQTLPDGTLEYSGSPKGQLVRIKPSTQMLPLKK